jgi:hypothetical protein
MAAGFGSLNDSRLVDAGTYFGGQVVKTSTGTAGNLMVCAADTDIPAGVLQKMPDVGLGVSPETDAGTICVAGLATGLAGAAVAVGDTVVLKTAVVNVTNSTLGTVSVVGTLVPKVGAGWVVGMALQPAAAGEFFDMLVNIRKEPA